MREVKGSTKLGQQLLVRGGNCHWSNLSYLYKSWSREKQQAFDRCFEMFARDDNATAFGVGNANTFGFSASWNTIYNGESVMRLETKDNSYIIYYER